LKRKVRFKKNKTFEFKKENGHKVKLNKLDYFTKDRIPKCAICREPMKRVYDSKLKKKSKYIWELDCECIKKNLELKSIRLSIG